MKNTTQELINQIKQADNIEEFLRTHKDDLLSETTHGLLNQLVSEKDMKISEVAERSGQGDYVYKVFGGKRKASRNILIAIALGMKLNIAQTQLLMRVSGYSSLDPRVRRDSVIIYALEKSVDTERVNDILYDLGESTL